MTNFNEALTRRAVGKGVELLTELNEAQGRQARTVAHARFAGFIAGLHFALEAQGVATGPEPFATELLFIDARKLHGEPPQRGLAFNQAYIDWRVRVVTNVIEALKPKTHEDDAGNRYTVGEFLDGLVAGGGTNIV
jgi:hypothetical protein